jgi:hypothetical protein
MQPEIASGHRTRVNDLARLDRPHIGYVKCHDCNCITGQGRELNLITRPLLMHQDNGANITSGQSLNGQITFQYDEVQFLDHRPTILPRSNLWSCMQGRRRRYGRGYLMQ